MNKVKRCKEQGARLHRTSVESSGARWKKKLLAKSNWFKGSRKKETITNASSNTGGKKSNGAGSLSRLKTRSVLFVEQTPHGELAKQLRELLVRLEATMGFKIKVVERAGMSLASQFSQTSIWEGSKCGRLECLTCNQGAEDLQPCTRTSAVYENVCSQCNPEILGKGELKRQNGEHPSIYVGETSRSVQERSLEHWAPWRRRDNDGHITKHQLLHHGGADPPDFTMKVISSHRSALSRQVMEAVRIRRRGGESNILNSKGEFNRSHISRLTLEQKEDKEILELRREQKLKNSKKLDCWLEDWKRSKTRAKDQERCSIVNNLGALETTTSQKREPGAMEQKKAKKYKHSFLEESWGEEEPPSLAGGAMEDGTIVLPHNRNLIQHTINGYLATTPACNQLQAAVVPQNSTVDEEKLSSATNLLPNEDTSLVSSDEDNQHPEVTPPSPPLVTNLMENQSVMHTPLPEPSMGVLINQETTASDKEDILDKCNFKRGGYCLTHKVGSLKHWNYKDIWTKKKDGTYDWKTTKKVEYKCMSSNKAVPKKSLVTTQSSHNRDGAVYNGNHSGDLSL